MEFREAYCSLLRNCALLTVPALVGYAAAAPWLVPAIFGQQWYEAGRVAVPLGLLAVPFATTYFYQSALTALGHAAWQRQMAIVDMLSVVLVSLVAVQYDLLSVVVAYAIRAYVWIPVQIHLLKKVSGIGFRDHLMAFAPAVAAAAIMAVGVSVAFVSLAPRNLIMIGLVCFAGAILYCAIVLAILPRVRGNVRIFLRRLAIVSD